MGDVIQLAERRRTRFQRRTLTAPTPFAERSAVEFAFDLASPFTYLLAEQVERAFDRVTWTPIPAALRPPRPIAFEDRLVLVAEERARALRLPLVWPDPYPPSLPGATRAATFASAQGRGAAFVLAATRLAFGGGDDLEDPEFLAAAAEAGGLDPDACLDAAADPTWDRPAHAAAVRLGVTAGSELPLLRSGRQRYAGEAEIGRALMAVDYARLAVPSSAR